MSSEKTTAIVLRIVEFSETSVVATLYTREFGKLGALAKGARRPKSPFEAALDLLAVCRIVFLHKTSGALDLLTEARLERRFRAAARSLSHLYAGYYVAELLNELTDHGDPLPELFDAADTALARLDAGDEIAGTLLAWEVTALRLIGQLPELTRCVECGGGVADTPRAWFGLEAGGLLCNNCRAGRRSVVTISSAALAALAQAAAALERPLPVVSLDSALRGELRGVMNHYLAHLVGHRLRLPDYLTVGR